MTASAPVVTLRAVGRSYGHGSSAVAVLADVDLDLFAGEVVALVGRSGSGKSTLCHVLAGVEPATSGTVRVQGRDLPADPDWQEVALLPQRLGLAAELTVAENAFLPCWLRGRAGDPAVLDLLGLDSLADRRAGSTSLGEQQRAAIARLLSSGSRVAVLDEPTGHQDDDNVGRVQESLELARASGTAVLVATHDDRLVRSADRVVRLENGRVVA
jgi:ABC-type lipoprotein export system ATPase subunit